MTATIERRPREAGRQHPVGVAVWRALADTGVVFGLFGWIYAAVIAVFDPNGLPTHFVSWLPIRRDTLGVICFVISVCAHFAREMADPTKGAALTDIRGSSRSAETAVLRTLFTYCSLLSLYLLANSITHPETMVLPLTHLFRLPTEEQVLAISLFCAITSYLILRAESHFARLGEGPEQ